MQIPLSITAAIDAMQAGSHTATELVDSCLARSEAHDAMLGVFLHQDTELARSTAAAIDLKRAQNEPVGKLAGIPLGIKDNIFTEDAPTTAQSLVRNPVATGDAPVVSRLRDAGAIFMGKTSTLEFAVGFNGASSPFPMPRNPWDPSRWSGGSSSGTSSGVQSQMFLGGLGTDTAGSIRMPAAWCGVTGHKPSYGMVPRTGIVPLGWTLDHAGPIARSAEDCALLLSVIAGPDHQDRSVLSTASFTFADIELDLRGLRIGIAREPMDRSVGEVRDLVTKAAQTFRSLGAEVSEVMLPDYDEVIDAVMLGLAAEAFLYHRTDAIDRWTDFGHGTRSALLTGALLSSTDYLQTLRVRRNAQRKLSKLFSEVDLIIAPTATHPAPPVDDFDFQRVVGMLQTHYWNGTGHPALSVPMGSVDGLPVGLQITGRPFADKQVLDAGRIWQAHTNHHMKVAPL